MIESTELAHGKALLHDWVQFPEQGGVYGELVHWLTESADLLIAAAEERNRLDWLRKHPESCRALHDCREPRAEGFIFCVECLDKGVGGYFDVYRAHVERECAKIMKEELALWQERLGFKAES